MGYSICLLSLYYHTLNIWSVLRYDYTIKWFNNYPAAVHAQSRVNQSVLSVCQSVTHSLSRKKMRTVYGFIEHLNKTKMYLLPFLGAGFIYLALSSSVAVQKINEVSSVYRNCKLRANTDGMHNDLLNYEEHADVHKISIPPTIYSQYNVVYCAQ